MRRQDNKLTFLRKYQPQLVKKQLKTLYSIEQQLAKLNGDEREEWAQIIHLKSQSTLNSYQQTPHHPQYKGILVSNVLRLLIMRDKFKLDSIDDELMEAIVKEVCYTTRIQKESHNDIVKSFIEYGFRVDEYEYLVYEEPIYSRVYNWFFG